MINKGCPSSTSGGGGGTSNTTEKRATTSLRQQGGGRQATTCRDGLALLRSSKSGQQMGQNNNRIGAMLKNTQTNTRHGGGTLNYIEIKQLIERCQLNNKRGKLTDKEIKLLVKDWHNQRAEEDLNQTTVEMEMKAMERRWNNSMWRK